MLYIAMKDPNKAQKWSLMAQGLILPSHPTSTSSQDVKANEFWLNPKKAAKKLSKIDDLDSSTAFMLGIIYEVGLGVRRNMKVAMTFYGKSAAKDNDIAKYHLQKLYVS